MSRVGLALLASAALGLTLGVAGCGDGDDGSDTAAVQQEIEEARREGAREAVQRDRIEGLQKRLNRLERNGTATTTASSQEPAEATTTGGAGSSVLQAFHTPNVACEIRSDGAFCSVASIDETFAFESGGAAYTESGSRVAQGSGAVAEWGSTVSSGSITCTIPPLEEPSGITCVDEETGHGFEASRVPSRQQVY